jgi:hypothetical protein
MKLRNLIGARGMDRSAARHPERVNCRCGLAESPAVYDRAPVPARLPPATVRYSSRIGRPFRKSSRISRTRQRNGPGQTRQTRFLLDTGRHSPGVEVAQANIERSESPHHRLPDSASDLLHTVNVKVCAWFHIASLR